MLVPQTWMGKPSATAASTWLSDVMTAQEKSRAMPMTDERAASSMVLVISRQTASMRFAMTGSRTGSMRFSRPSLPRVLVPSLPPSGAGGAGLQQVVGARRSRVADEPG